MPPKPIVEDVSHGQLDVLLMVNAEHAKCVFDRDDLKKVCNTFLHNVVKPDRSNLNGQVDGTPGAERYEGAAIAGWLLLAEYDPGVYEVCRQVYEKRGKESLYSLARLLNWQKKLAQTQAK